MRRRAGATGATALVHVAPSSTVKNKCGDETARPSPLDESASVDVHAGSAAFDQVVPRSIDRNASPLLPTATKALLPAATARNGCGGGRCDSNSPSGVLAA